VFRCVYPLLAGRKQLARCYNAEMRKNPCGAGLFSRMHGSLTGVHSRRDPLGASSTPWGVDYGRITPLIVKAVQDIATISATFKTNLIAWLADAQNGITDFFANVGNFGRVNTDELCVDDVCVTRDEFLRMKEAQSAAAGAQSAGSGRAPAGSSAREEDVRGRCAHYRASV
jgi:hypothetical protein